MDLNKKNDRLQRVQIDREKDIPLFEKGNNLWFLIIYKNGDWDSENNLAVFLEDIKRDLIDKVFCVWHGNHRTNLFLMKKYFILNAFKDKQSNKQSRGDKEIKI